MTARDSTSPAGTSFERLARATKLRNLCSECGEAWDVESPDSLTVAEALSKLLDSGDAKIDALRPVLLRTQLYGTSGIHIMGQAFPYGVFLPERAARHAISASDGGEYFIDYDALKDEWLDNRGISVNGVFAPYTSIPTNILFFDRSKPTEDVWYYEQPLPEGRKNYTKTQPMQFEDFSDCIAWWPHDKRVENERAWKVKAADLLANGCNLDVKNPRGREDFEHMPPEKLVDEILAKELRIAEILREIKSVLHTEAV
jgi:hypothetical protein